LAAASPAEAIEVSSAPPTQTLISELWEQRKKVRQGYEATEEIRDRLKDELPRLMPKPHPSITYSRENDEEGLKHENLDPYSYKMHSYIPSDLTEKNLNNIRPARVEEVAVNNCYGFVFRKEPLPLSPELAALRELQTARLELSRKYEREIRRVKSKIGLTAANKKLDKLCHQQIDLEDQIMSARCTTRSDFAIKIAIYDIRWSRRC
jgi:hypothetical protein